MDESQSALPNSANISWCPHGNSCYGFALHGILPHRAAGQTTNINAGELIGTGSSSGTKITKQEN